MKVASMVRAAALLVAVGGLLVASNAKATLLIGGDVVELPGQPVTVMHYVDGVPNAGNPTEQEIADALGITLAQLGTLQYKSDAAGVKDGVPFPQTEEGPLQAYYQTEFIPEQNPTSAIITWIQGSPQWVDPAQSSYLLVKDGDSGSLAWTLMAIPWDGQAEIQVADLWPNANETGYKAISHVAIYGGMAAVPEPTTMVAGALLLLPFGLSTLRVLRRNRKA